MTPDGTEPFSVELGDCRDVVTQPRDRAVDGSGKGRYRPISCSRPPG
jgi:hypothetical protein